MDLISQNKSFFDQYPKIKNALFLVPKPIRGYWYDASFHDGALFLFEMTSHKKFNMQVSTDRLIMIDEDGNIKDTMEAI